MTRYRRIAAELAGQIAAGELAPGAELPSVRVLAARSKTTTSTAARALRALADAGVITAADRRRARVAPDGDLAARRFLHAERVFRLAGSDDPALDVVTRGLAPSIVRVSTAGSFAGLRAVVQGQADGATVHLRHRNGEYNAPFAQALLRGRHPHLVHLWRREQGLIVPPGAKTPVDVTDLVGRRVAKRRPGTGTRILFDRLLLEAGHDPDTVRGPEVDSHLEVALAVATGVADAGLGARSAARDLDLGFVPVTWENYDIVLPGDTVDALTPLIAALRDPEVRAEVTSLGGYDLEHAGEIIDLSTRRSRRADV